MHGAGISRSTTYGGERIAEYRDDFRTRRGGVDLPFAILTLILLVMGVVTVFSSSFARAYYDLEQETGGNAAYYFTRQLVFAVGGVLAMFIC